GQDRVLPWLRRHRAVRRRVSRELIMSTFITKLDAAGDGTRVAVKDIVDVEGVPTTAGCRAVERTAEAAKADAACLAGARAADARLVGKANLHELAMLPIGTNPWFGTPVNPRDPDLIPGGSSSGSAVAVGTDEADVAALQAAEFEVVPVDWEIVQTGADIFTPIYFSEVWAVDHDLIERDPDGVGPDIAQTVAMADVFRPGVDDARRALEEWRQTLADLFARVEILALPTLP